MTSPPIQPLGYATPIPGSPDVEHLRLLVIFHYVGAALSAFFGVFPGIYILLGVLFITGRMQNNGPPPPAGMGYLFIVMGSVGVAFMWGLAICLLISGRSIARRRHYMFTFIIAAISCLQIPLGTALGVFTMVVLSRPSVKAMYGR